MNMQPMSEAVPIWIQPQDMLIEWDLSSAKLQAELKIAELVGPVGKLVDLGCGNGRYAKVMNYQSYTGFDSSYAMIADAKQRNPNCEFAIIDIFKFVSDEQYDTLLLVDVAIHMVDPVAAVKTIINNWTAGKYVVTLLVGLEHQVLLNSTIISHVEFLSLLEVGMLTDVLYSEHIPNENFEWRVLQFSRI